MTKPQQLKKEQEVSVLSQYISESSFTVLTDYRGLDVAEVTELRAKMREAGITFKVAKNTLIKLAAHEQGITDLDSYLEGPTAVAFSADPVTLAKILVDFAKTHNDLEIKAGLLEKKNVGVEDLKNLAELPPREVLLAKALGAMQSPMYGFAGSLAGLLRKFVYALDQVREQKEQA
ncbi:50S ribosomal protein L10 [Dehalobacterium formicoaceticum]|uniref:Large ribosomal subunit protein uL10 n=1 Tax=Dehalobacterium formicoaceticum TaxID=51515 RepID=A0ABT1XZ92_9FIRM|nr:50S ribosomal protein L10 [Dehalobacterium formicoaceticum]MCR6543944.1 50S ribosomal protein L10 [Dehalobacterium formicoaceticum]